ncbi:MAG: adenylate/guanylate cyclase domain-containing protein [Pseudomonadota bacterium]|nr:adenylate/guanylate cyclase domain-containing protein [Pseudomonadota bacterium]
MGRWHKAWLLGVATAVIGIAASGFAVSSDWEADLGLGLLFKLRGARQSPPDILVVGIDRESSRVFDVPNRPDKWSRRLHARLVDRLAAAGARVIAFDVLFRDRRDKEHDRALAESVRKAGNVLLIEDLVKERGTSRGGGPAAIEHRLQKVTLPFPELAAAAFGTAPFPLPWVPDKLSQFWLFSPEEGEPWGDKACLPTLALLAYATPFFDDLLRLVSETTLEFGAGVPEGLARRDSLADLSLGLRQLLRSHPDLVNTLRARVAGLSSQEARGVLDAVISAYGGARSRAVNFYGPPRTVTSLSYHCALGVDCRKPHPGHSAQTEAGLRDWVHGKAVFVGFSEWVQMEQRDVFHTHYTQVRGERLSGVEIAATVFSNLRERNTIQAPGAAVHVSLIAFFGLVLGVGARGLGPSMMLPLAAAVMLLYVAAAYYAFSIHHLWLPLVIPLLVQGPIAIGGGLYWGFRDTRREREQLQKTFGYYLPPAVVAELCGAAGRIPTASRDAYAVCLFSDAERYTTLAEGLSPQALHALLNRYYDALFEPVRRHGGFVSDVVGDAMLALWATAGPDPETRVEACRAALEIMAGSPGDSGPYLPTRIGLHCGEVVLGNVGAGEHFEYRAVGDIVNTAQRIEDLNKRLGTRVLASADVIEGLAGGLGAVLVREIGRFCLIGKSRPLTLHQLWLPGTEAADLCERRRAAFAVGLAAFRIQDFGQAGQIFEALLQELGEDGPARFYLALCKRYRRTSAAAPWDGTVYLDEVLGGEPTHKR